MSKFCPIANAYTNCTDNCHSCLEEQEKESKMNHEEEAKNASTYVNT